jgi:hypothetical protein
MSDPCGNQSCCPKPKTNPFENTCVNELEIYDENVVNSCFGWKGLTLHIICALKRIAAAIEALLTTPAPVQTGTLCLRISDWETITNGSTIDVPISTASFEYDILGFGVSYVPPAFSDAHGAYVFGSSDVLKVTPWDYTSGVALGNELSLSTAVKVANQSDEGNKIAELHIGHVIGLKMTFDADPGDSITDFPIDFFVFVKPAELNPE